ncbi:MAG: hypothetical protein B7X93_05965 [Hydrogenophilales bacterium 17-61-9]|nr:MAG: hypothetical protein B7X93_05965 [Hydrogenophilales bacterium 17-61-9]
MNRKNGFWIALWATLIVVTGFLAFGAGSGGMGYGPWQGWGRMGGWDNSHRLDGSFGGYATGRGMTGGTAHGQGWGMDMPYAMMGQDGMGGMGAGMGFGMPGGGFAMMPWQLPRLTPEQEQKISPLWRDSAERNFSLMQQRREAQARLSGLYATGKRDWNAIRAASQQVFELQRRQHDAAIDLQQKIDGLLTDSQRQDLARAWHGYGWMGASP